MVDFPDDHQSPGLDLKGFLQESGSALLEIDQPVSTKQDITAFQHQMDKSEKYPVILIKKPVLPDGTISAFPLVCNLTASRELVSKVLSLADHREAAISLAAANTEGIAPTLLKRSEAAIAEVELTGDEIDLTRLPATTQHIKDPGPYLTAAHATTYEPSTRIDNTAIQRCWIKGPRQMSWYPYPSSHNAANLRKWWDRGEPCPVAFWIGHHPSIVIGTQAKLKYPQSHWGAAGGLAGVSIPLTTSLSLGSEIKVPANAEIVIEGLARPGNVTADGPFGEYTGYSGPQIIAPLVDVVAITHRKNAIYHDYGSGLTDMLIPDNMSMEGKLYSIIKSVAPSLRNVHVPSSGRRFHAWLQLDNPGPGEARDALAAAMSYRRVKTTAVFDNDIDIFDERAVLWAIATRVQWHRDTLRLDGLSTSTLDPSLAAGELTGSKLGIDATLPRPQSNKMPRPVSPVATCDSEAMERAKILLASLDSYEWPVA